MKKRLITKRLRKKLSGKKHAKIVRVLERKLKVPLIEQAQSFAAEARNVEKELLTLQGEAGNRWKLLVDIKRICFMIDEIVAILNSNDYSIQDPEGE